MIKMTIVGTVLFMLVGCTSVQKPNTPVLKEVPEEVQPEQQEATVVCTNDDVPHQRHTLSMPNPDGNVINFDNVKYTSFTQGMLDNMAVVMYQSTKVPDVIALFSDGSAIWYAHAVDNKSKHDEFGSCVMP